MVGSYRLFGDLLPFIGFEDYTISGKEFNEKFSSMLKQYTTQQWVSGNFLTIEWFGHGISFGKFEVRVKE